MNGSGNAGDSTSRPISSNNGVAYTWDYPCHAYRPYANPWKIEANIQRSVTGSVATFETTTRYAGTDYFAVDPTLETDTDTYITRKAGTFTSGYKY